MPQLCFYLQLHQPYRLRDYRITELNSDAYENHYFSLDEFQGNRAVFKKVAEKSYLPMLQLLLHLTQTQPNFVFALSCSGVFLEQAQLYEPRVIDLLWQLASTGKVEFLAETYYHSLSSLFSQREFLIQVHQHYQRIQQLFQQSPKVFRNTELIYSNDIAQLVHQLGFLGMLTEAVPRYLGNRKKTQIFVDKSRQLPLLLKHAELSDDVAFRFSDPQWPWYPLHADRYLEWLNIYPENEIVNLFMDFETFGEHQWESTGIFNFFTEFVRSFLSQPWNHFVTPSQAFASVQSAESKKQLPVYDVPNAISWADIDRDVTAWCDNDFQQDTLSKIYHLADAVYQKKDPALLHDWRKLQTSDHFYYMCTKWSADGDVHAYFSPYRDPYEAYRRYSIVLADVQDRLLAA